MDNNNNKIKELEEDIKLALDRLTDSLEISLDEDIEITKMKILYLIYQNLKGINERLNEIANKFNSSNRWKR
jgi:hypothetical protein